MLPARRHFLAAATAGALLSACARQRAGGSGWPPVLRYTISIAGENPEAEGSRLQPIRQYLARKLNMPVEVWGSNGYGVSIEALRAKKIEAATLGAFGYVIGAGKAGIEAIAARGTMEGAVRQYWGTLSVAARSPVRTIEDLRARSRELTISFVDPASTSGNLVQRAYLRTVGIDPERDFKKVLYANDHPAAALTLLAGRVDVGGFGENALLGLISMGKVKPDEIRIVWKSPPIPEPCVAVRKDLPEEFKRKLQQALVEMAAEAPDAYGNSHARIYRERYRNTRFVPATDATYEPVRQLARAAGNLNISE